MALFIENRNRVFFHELGHFVAGELNKKLFGHLGTIGIYITKAEGHYGEYKGACEPEKPQDHAELDECQIVPKERLPQYLARISYGCIFQAYHLKSDLETCSKTNGKDDFSGWSCALIKNGYDSTRKELSEDMDKYLSQLKIKEHLRPFFEINPDNFLESDGADGYKVKMDYLRTSIDKFIEGHVETYKNHIENYKSKLDL